MADVNTVQCDKISSNYGLLVIKTTVSQILRYQDIKNQIVASNMDLLSVTESFSSPKRRLWFMRESFLSKNAFVKIFHFVNKSQSLIRKVSTVKKKVSC